MNYIKTGIGMSTKNKRKKTKGITLILIVFVVVILSFFLHKTNIPIVSQISSGIVGFLDGSTKTIGGIFKEGFGYFGNIKTLKEENRILAEEKADLKYSLLAIPTLEKENETLRVKLGIKERYNHFKLEYADVVIRNYNSWDETFEINKGKNQGIKEKQTVVVEQGLIGYISKVEDNTSTVTTILDPGTAVSIDISSVNKVALVKGDFTLKKSGNLKLVYIPIDTEVSISETIYTSGIGGVYPKGIPVGIIIKVVNKKNEIDRYAVVKPVQNIADVKSVAIIVN